MKHKQNAKGEMFLAHKRAVAKVWIEMADKKDLIDFHIFCAVLHKDIPTLDKDKLPKSASHYLYQIKKNNILQYHVRFQLPADWHDAGECVYKNQPIKYYLNCAIRTYIGMTMMGTWYKDDLKPENIGTFLDLKELLLCDKSFIDNSLIPKAMQKRLQIKK